MNVWFVYINDILINSKSEDDHIRDLKQILGKLQQHKLLANAKKNEFLLKELDFLAMC